MSPIYIQNAVYRSDDSFKAPFSSDKHQAKFTGRSKTGKMSKVQRKYLQMKQFLFNIHIAGTQLKRLTNEITYKQEEG